MVFVEFSIIIIIKHESKRNMNSYNIESEVIPLTAELIPTVTSLTCQTCFFIVEFKTNVLFSMKIFANGQFIGHCSSTDNLCLLFILSVNAVCFLECTVMCNVCASMFEPPLEVLAIFNQTIIMKPRLTLPLKYACVVHISNYTQVSVLNTDRITT